ncbi:MAG: hypothetical protein ACE5OW_04650 [Candidatus Bathyarchaeia archaeon]
MAGGIFVIGLGALGTSVLQQLARTPGISKIVAADIDEKRGKEVVDNTISGAAISGFYPDIRFVKIDLFDVEGTTELLKEVEPSLIFNATTLASWWFPHLLPTEIGRKVLEAGLGPWIPCHLTLTYKLMQAVKKSGLDVPVANASYNDAVAPILSKVGLTPTVGGGNLDLLVPKIKKVVSEKLKVPMREVTVFLLAHHAVITTVGKAPFRYKILIRDKNVTDKFTAEEIRRAIPPLYRIEERWVGAPLQYDIAASFVKNMLAVYFDTNELSHAPGPRGLPGGFPVRINAKGVEVVLPEELTLDDAIKINEEAARFDGIEKIKDDGTTVLTDKAAKLMKEALGYDCKQFKLAECAEKAKELVSLYKETLKKHKIPVPYE